MSASLGFPVHEQSLLSGLVIADGLGVPYPFAGDPPAKAAFEAMRRPILPAPQVAR